MSHCNGLHEHPNPLSAFTSVSFKVSLVPWQHRCWKYIEQNACLIEKQESQRQESLLLSFDTQLGLHSKQHTLVGSSMGPHRHKHTTGWTNDASTENLQFCCIDWSYRTQLSHAFEGLLNNRGSLYTGHCLVYFHLSDTTDVVFLVEYLIPRLTSLRWWFHLTALQYVQLMCL